MISETRLIIQEINHTQSGIQLDETQARIYRTSSVSLSTEARVSAAQLTAEIPVSEGMVPRPGSMVILEATNDEGIFVRVFVGFIFNYNIDRWGVISITAYDAMRYLQNPATGKWVGKDGIDVSEIIRSVVKSCGLEQMAKEMQAEQVGVKPIRLIKIAESGLNIIDEILEWAQLKATADENGVTTKGGKDYAATRAGERWVFFDNCGTLVLCTANQMVKKVLGWDEPPVIGTGCAVTEMSMNVSIDDSANQVWLLRASGGGMAGWKAEDPERVSQWGPITYYEKIDNAFCRNNEQMQLRAAIELCSRDIEKRSIDITTLGLTGLRAGMLVRINIPWLEDYFGEISKSKLVFLDNVSHSWEEGTHTMTLKADALPGDVDLDIWKRMTTSVQRTKSKKNDTKKASLSNASTESTSNESSTSFWEMINPFS
jgi:hypothetical protein